MSSWFEFEYYIQFHAAHLFNITNLETSYVVTVKVSLIEKV